MAPRPKYGRIRIEGRTWRWTAMGSAGPGGREPECRWVVRFRDMDDPMHSVQAELSPRDSVELTEGRLRRLFSSGLDGSATEEGLERSEVGV